MAFTSPVRNYNINQQIWVTFSAQLAESLRCTTALAHPSFTSDGKVYVPKFSGWLLPGDSRPATDTEILAAKLMGDYV